ncbi:ATP-dependent DNA ligase [Streptomyces sp. NBC_01443]|uniref:ATP-dependent DNA ligase n=1 Tax=Streptomyces sp. NBC_01443 TaxID=2903868 RepID=UPI0022539393|nr:ATP-dependent DNA ligase [Streptomyces sp. NBC_01443]MCX4632847.1 ATP-dependent DNA ligase [Streptomyces sp. NBC_01443]MCX4633147.1 ATP-dependent DNA ligase [Streptomyces sp. NBC_01443]
MVLRPPVEPMLAQAAEVIPPVRPLTSGMAYEQKFDGYRVLVFTPAAPGGRVLLQTRRGSLVQGAFPDLVAAAEAQLPAGLVLDGELLVWDAGASALSFEGLQRRAAARAGSAPGLAARLPAFFVVFDVLQLDGRELLDLPYVERRARLEALFADHALTAPWTLCPMTTDVAKAREWLESWTEVSGVEGIVVKPQTSRYLPGHRGAWTKVRRRDTTEAIIGAITGTLARPQLLILGRHDQDGRLRTVGRTVPLRTEAARLVAEHLTAAGPGHPWEGVTFAATWGSRDVLDVRLVRPELVAEISADRAVDRGGVWRHPLRFRRLRLDVGIGDVPRFGVGSAAAAG